MGMMRTLHPGGFNSISFGVFDPVHKRQRVLLTQLNRNNQKKVAAYAEIARHELTARAGRCWEHVVSFAAEMGFVILPAEVPAP
jgi:hypothetical protein